MLLHALVTLHSAQLERIVCAWLRDADLAVESAPPDQIWRRIGQETIDLVVVAEQRLPRPWRDTLARIVAQPDRPTIVVFTSHDEPERRAALLSAGCEVVIEDTLPPEQVVEILDAVVRRRRQRPGPPASLVAAEQAVGPSLKDFVSQSPTMQAFMAIVHRIAPTRSTVLIEGETGVGKERLARALHADGPSGRGPFVAVNCGALPESLLESELFGHEKGAFTGATRARRGCFELADGGTLFLDEVGEIALHLQVKLLRALQEREIQRVGGEQALPVDVRIIAATNRSLVAEVASGRFRSDLLYRLNVISLEIPPLRERVADLPTLCTGIIETLALRIGCDVVPLAPAASAALAQYPWPGNLRELINVLERALLLCDGRCIRAVDLPASIRGAPAGDTHPPRAVESIPAEWLALPLPEARRLAVSRLEAAYLRAVLQRCNGKVGEAARQAGIGPRALYAHMRRLGLDKHEFRRKSDT